MTPTGDSVSPVLISVTEAVPALSSTVTAVSSTLISISVAVGKETNSSYIVQAYNIR